MALPGSPDETIICTPSYGKRGFEGRSAEVLYYERTGGLAWLMTGQAGGQLYTSNATRKTIADDVYDAGHSVAIVRWHIQGSLGGLLYQMAGKGYRHAYGQGWRLVIQLAFKTGLIQVPEKIVAAGNSGGGMQALYASQSYGLDAILSGIVQSGGPPLFEPRPGSVCTGDARTDYLMGFATGVCGANSLTDPERAAYDRELLNGGRMRFRCPIRLVNAEDHGADPLHGTAFVRVAREAGSDVEQTLVSGSSHDVDTTVAGAAAISGYLLELLEAT